MAAIQSGPDSPGILNRQQRGARYEQQARRYLERKGLRFVAANVHVRGGEIDLIMKQRQVIVFVEVRFRRNDKFGGAAASVTLAAAAKVLIL